MWTLYGWWLPNDPRGSTSRVIRNNLIADLGELHFGRKRIQPVSADLRQFYQQARRALTHPLLSFDSNDFAFVAESFAEAIEEFHYTCYACAMMPDHVHLVIRKHRDRAEEMIEKIQSLSRKRIVERGLREHDHPVWTRGGWKVFLDHPEEVRRTIGYVENNLLKIQLPRQKWTFVQPYDNWPLHPGHSPNSPYIRALCAAGRYP